MHAMPNDKDNKPIANLHARHREKLRQRLRTEGPDHFEDHQLLEALLFFSIPRKDTNDTAHSLIEQTGSLSAVFAADRDVLCKIDGVGEHSATLIKLVNGIMRRISMEDVKPREKYNSAGKLAKYFANLFVGLSKERSYLMLLDNDYRILDCILVCDGTINALPILTRNMIEKAVMKQASMAVFAHNHPNGSELPSHEDIEVTHHLISAFYLFGITLLEHMVIAGNKYFPIIRNMTAEEKQEHIKNVNVSRAAIIPEADFYADEGCEIVTDLPAQRCDGLDTI